MKKQTKNTYKIGIDWRRIVYWPSVNNFVLNWESVKQMKKLIVNRISVIVAKYEKHEKKQGIKWDFKSFW